MQYTMQQLKVAMETDLMLVDILPRLKSGDSYR